MIKSSTKQQELPLAPALPGDLNNNHVEDPDSAAVATAIDELFNNERSADENPEQAELFVVMDKFHDWPIKDDMSTMEFPIFSLAKIADTKVRSYSRGGKTVRVIPSAFGAATVFDKDLVIYCISQIVQATEAGIKVGRRIKINVHPFLVSTKRGVGGKSYENVIDMCRRLKGTTIETNIKTNEEERVKGFGLIEDYEITQYTKNGKGALELELTISDWLYRAALETDILTLHPNYFKLGKSLERRLYEIARKHCGNQPWWIIALPSLQEKVGSTQEARFFKQEVKGVSSSNLLPEYKLFVDESVRPNQLVVLTRDNPKLVSEAVKRGKWDWISGVMSPTKAIK